MGYRSNLALANWALTVLLTCVVWNPSSAHGQPLDGHELVAALDTVLDSHPTARRTTVTLKVVELQTGTVLYDRGGDRLLTPASNLKIYTSACALDCFGPEHHFSTRLVATGPIREGVLQGNLLLVGGGNAMLTSRELFELAAHIVEETKLGRVEGRVVVDNSRYDRQLKGPGWMWDDDPDYYNMPVTPTMVDFNVLTVRLMPAGHEPPRVTLVPPASYPPIHFQPRGGGAKPYAITRKPFQDPIEVRGQGPVGKPIEKRITMHDPARWVAALMTGHFRGLGVEFVPPAAGLPRGNGSRREKGAKPGKGAAWGEGRQWRIEGVSLAKTLNHFHEVSENGVGEVLLHELAIAHGSQQPTWSAGSRVMTHWLTETAGLEAGSFSLVDGSGLSRYNLISADSAVKLLAFMHQHRDFKTFFDSLRVYSVEQSEVGKPAATIATERFSAHQISAHQISAKSGSMTGVATISGYVRTRAGRPLAFSLLANGFLGSTKPLHELRGQVWRVLVRYRADGG